MDERFNKFYKKSIEERLEILRDLNYLEGENLPNLDKEVANNMIENYLLNYEIPLGLAMNFVIDGQRRLIPMAIEEPSVVAAASNGAKILGDIKTEIEDKAVVGQIVLYQIKDVTHALNQIENNKEGIFQKAASLCQSMIKRGGGPRKVWAESFEDEGESFISLYLSVDTCDAMGANTINTILESISDYVEEITDSKFLMRIISNYSTESIVKASAQVDIIKLDKDIDKARNIAKRIEKASIYADLDPYRATTHNKGIMNGIDAVVLATGNDFRAIEASAHSYACRDGEYKSLTKWRFDEASDRLYGSIEIPLPVATLGGTISVHPIAKWSLGALGNPSAKSLASIIAAVGLSQNFSAIRAIVTVGIQKGHMSLHARSVAKQVGANASEIDELVDLLKKEDKINPDRALILLEKLRGANDRIE